jgi:hypothetical protein
METADLQRFRDLKTEYSKPKRMYAELSMENHALNNDRKKAAAPVHKRPLLA